MLVWVAIVCAVLLTGVIAFGAWAVLGPSVGGDLPKIEDAPMLGDGPESHVAGDDYVSVAGDATDSISGSSAVSSNAKSSETGAAAPVPGESSSDRGDTSNSGAGRPSAPSENSGAGGQQGSENAFGKDPDAHDSGDQDKPAQKPDSGDQGKPGVTPDSGDQSEGSKPDAPQAEWGPVV